MNGSGPTVFVVDDDPGIQGSLRWLMESVGLAVKTFETAEQFLASYDPDHGGCLVLDVRMPGMSGLELQQQLQTRRIALPVIIISGHSDVSMAVQAMKAGALDFIEKPIHGQSLLDKIYLALRQDTDRRASDTRKRAIGERLETLTPRERQVLALIVQGRLNKQVATELGLSEKTVEIHRSNLMRKLKATTPADLVRMVLTCNGEQFAPIVS